MSAALALAGALIAGGCGEATGPPVEIEGGGFIFNYRIAEAFYGVSLRPTRRLLAGSVIEATFEDPAGGAPFVVAETVRGAKLSVMLRTPPLAGIVRNRDYRVEIRVRDPSGRPIGTITRTFRSDLDQSALPPAPLTVGPGYTPNPAVPVRR